MVCRRLMVAVLVVAVASSGAVLPASAFAVSAPKVTVPASLLVTTDGRVLWSHHAGSQRRVASTIKMLTALVVRKHASLDETVTVTAKAANTEGSGLSKGQHVTVRTLLQLMLVASVNDAAEALAIHVGGSEAHFVKMMNARAAKIGLKHTHAIDPHGLSKREHSTASDLAVLARLVMKDPVLRSIVGMRSAQLPLPGHKPKKFAATDQLLGKYRGLVGVKTGFTKPAGYCFVGWAERGSIRLQSVILGAKAQYGRFSQTRKLLDWGFAGFKSRRLVSTATTMGSVAVSGGAATYVTVHASRDASAVVWTHSPYTRKIVLPAPVNAPVHRGDQLGVVVVSQGGKQLLSVALVADSGVVKAAVRTSSSAPVDAAPASGPLSARPSMWARIASLPGRAWAAILGSLNLGNPTLGLAL
jgi:serine-type D-Ala-D-Ala carboxypeptidase (penicillin-binding protein 5/6)